MADAKGEIKYGFYLGIGLMLAILLWGIFSLILHKIA